MNRHLDYDILVILDYYLPGHKAGGPITTIANMIDILGNEFRFLVLTRNKDIDGATYSGLPVGKVVNLGKADVVYLDEERLGLRDLVQYALLSGARVIYLNSFFSVLSLRFLVAHRLGLLKTNIILAPRGEFAEAAYAYKGFKKRTYLNILNILRMLSCVRWHVSTEYEAEDLQRVLGYQSDVLVAPDPFCAGDVSNGVHERDLIYISRISPKKGLHYALKCLALVKLQVTLDIYGPIEDGVYWQLCQKIIAELPSHVNVHYHGPLSREEVPATFGHYSAFLFPTEGENYGHVIPEALAAGTPVILSDQTPWRDLQEAGVGYVLPLGAPERFAEAVEILVHSSAAKRQTTATLCKAYARRVENDTLVQEQNRHLFSKPFTRG